jgi:CRP/FNR family cyclic AMP-dependent transcriptional regulator
MKTTDLSGLLRDHPLFADLDPGHVEQVAGCGQNVRFAPGEVLFAEGEAADHFYLIRHGRVALETAVPGRGAMIIETVSTGEVVGWSWLLPPYRWHFDGRAVEPTTAVRFDGACLRAKLGNDPALGYALMRRFAEIIVERLQATRVRLLDVYGDGRD